MGGIIGYFLHINYYQLLQKKDLLLYNITNLYLYIYIFDVENIFFYKFYNDFFILFLILANFFFLFFFKNKIKNNRDFLFLSS